MLISLEGQVGSAAAASHVRTATETLKYRNIYWLGKWDQNSKDRGLLTEAVINQARCNQVDWGSFRTFM